MKLHLDYQVPDPPFKINYEDELLLIGSCFTEHIGHRLQARKFKSQVNPFGHVFNPSSMAKVMERMLSKTLFTDADLIFHEGLWHAWDAHGDFSKANKQELLNTLNDTLTDWYQFIRNAGTLVLVS